MEKKELRNYFILLVIILFINIISLFFLRLEKLPTTIYFTMCLPSLCLALGQTTHALIRLMKEKE